MRALPVLVGLMVCTVSPAQCLKVAVFAPNDAEPTCLKSIEQVLQNAGVPFDEVKERDVSSGAIVGKYDALILPGGAYATRLAHRSDFVNGLKRFAESGGKIIGICAGAITLVEGGLVRGKVEAAGLGVGKVTLRLERHPLTRGLPDRLEVTYINGPVMRSEGATVVARYAGGIVNHGDAILVDRYGKGEVIAIGPHPCHDERGNLNPVGSKLLLNALGVKEQRSTSSGESGGNPVPASVVTVVLGLAVMLWARSMWS